MAAEKSQEKSGKFARQQKHLGFTEFSTKKPFRITRNGVFQPDKRWVA
jgi:hypothetical protein